MQSARPAARRLAPPAAAALVFPPMLLDFVGVGVGTMINRTLVASLVAVVGLGLAIVPDTAFARAGGAGGVGAGAGRASFHGGARFARPPIRFGRAPIHFKHGSIRFPHVRAGKFGPFRHHAGKHRNNDAVPALIGGATVLPEAYDDWYGYPYGVGSTVDPTATGSV